MENQSSDDEQIEKSNLRSSVNVFHVSNKLYCEEEKRNSFRKRSSSMSLFSIPQNFVPKLKPIKTIICPSPINLNQKSTLPAPPEIQNTTISTSSFDSQNDLNLKPIKFICSKNKNQKKFSKIINIEEEAYAMSDYEDNAKNTQNQESESDTSKSDEEKDNNKINFNKINFNNNINLMREKMKKIKNNFISNENLFDDSNIGEKRLSIYKDLYQPNFINKDRKNKNMILNPLKKIKYRTKSFNIRQRYVPTILGFLEKSKSTHSLNSNGK